jgi:nucleotide-binding universal stress UspA family protein
MTIFSKGGKIMKTNRMKKVMIALDYNPTAQKVAETGYSLAESMKAEVILLHVITDPVYYSEVEYSPIMGFAGEMEMGPLELKSVDGLKMTSKKFLDKIKHHLGDGAIQTIVKDGDFADTILESAKELHADIIVMGSHSRKWLEDIVMGSVTETVLHHSTIPLFIIPTKKNK